MTEKGAKERRYFPRRFVGNNLLSLREKIGAKIVKLKQYQTPNTHTSITPHDQVNWNQFEIVENSVFFPFDLFPFKVREGNFCVALSLSAAPNQIISRLSTTDDHHHRSLMAAEKILHYTQLIIVTTPTTWGGLPFSSRRTFFHRECDMDCFKESLFRG